MWRTSAHQRLRSVREFAPPQQISTGFASWQCYYTASSSGHQPNFAALNRGRHLYSAGRPPRWTFAHILVVSYCGKISIYLRVVRWHNRFDVGPAIKRSRVQLPARTRLCNNYGQVVDTLVSLSPSSIMWYRSMGGDTLQLEK